MDSHTTPNRPEEIGRARKTGSQRKLTSLYQVRLGRKGEKAVGAHSPDCYSSLSAEHLVAHVEGVTKAIKKLDGYPLLCQEGWFLPSNTSGRQVSPTWSRLTWDSLQAELPLSAVCVSLPSVHLLLAQHFQQQFCIGPPGLPVVLPEVKPKAGD